MTLSTTLTERASDLLGRRTSRRSFLSRTAMVGSAISVAGSQYVLRPGTAYAAVCSCLGRSCDCSSLCCDGYTEFCCQIYGQNSCPPNTLLAGWWKVDNSSFCSGSARYYMDCNKRSPNCSCGSSGVCRGNDTVCQCRACSNRKDGCTTFRYGNCNNQVACVGPIMCRVVTCTKPWEIDPACTTVPRTDNNTRFHHRPCLDPDPTPQQLAFVEALYRDFFGRASDAAGREYWGSVLVQRQGFPIGGRDTVSYSFAFSIEYARTVATELYELALDRAPDTAGRDHWVHQLLNGLNPRDMAAELFGSEEFWIKSGRDLGRFVDRLYAKILGRAPSSSERSAWVGQLQSGTTRTSAAWSFYASLESRRRRVRAIYLRFLGRNPDASGLDYWAGVISSREDISVALYIASSEEYLKRAFNRFGGLYS